ncbi:MAG: hypothetical protein QF376_05285, partial [Anaerolineales bacterium]|nr:hypothetical protein [Anaerolineales bacterium]
MHAHYTKFDSATARAYNRVKLVLPKKGKPMGRSSDLSHAIEDYLKAIYELQQGKLPVSTSALAQRLGFASASVTGMLKKMAA